ncbi:MAG: hypothetical protein ACKOFI_04855, partial [Phycisphaerales bacterium]
MMGKSEIASMAAIAKMPPPESQSTSSPSAAFSAPARPSRWRTPIGLTVGGAFRTEDGGLTLRHLASALADPATQRGLVNAAMIAALTTSIALVLALPLALVGARCSFPGKAILGGLLLLPLVLPPFVGAIGVRHLLGRAGALNAALGLDIDWLSGGGIFAIAAMEAISLFPIMYLNVVASLANLDPALEEAGQCMGA